MPQSVALSPGWTVLSPQMKLLHVDALKAPFEVLRGIPLFQYTLLLLSVVHAVGFKPLLELWEPPPSVIVSFAATSQSDVYG
jgi:hypothetical protein